ncbi:FMN-dependent NADH-azoreductase [Halalkalibacterium halodurans]|jgi:FMN-dependent NADH-azoreductase|uniref:FMN-dependent NADH:quinone oxidoreductase 2 n=2 Tax=Halalkalibacterium halodurans TaxID=86665 RepID=AZOR2_HALH5|nr:FMN-dependent NADH-azoreductase [Halalkalibacterium halodurans]Q9K672.1 RecName: Full=FMN-dependent NADH:quinone oxidoreductase 2; AltName: Full=Azo-dye reductase 2; AltName: Full=FMN-dependent NADH-azo compound oxidoreductase 2; AltName: Full=FMN-dependent NADH-azoreductase 2 [Halalkalibacterium halodurans C-125]MDY7224364.1 FMN-dependent NADH-azoreductase [Halalkalibacterium halodurans]MDY7243649.1 FMN-dependent NADH-azoreductase [Halalkalibacterium halodurans]MED3645865.1 FMN-dependent NA
MSKVLFVKGNPRSVDESVSVKMYQTFVDTYKEANPNDEVIELDIYNEQLPYLDSTMLAGIFKAGQQLELTAEEEEARKVADRYLTQFVEADKVVFAFPLWNFTIPAALHTYMDYLARAGVTFNYTAEGPVGLMGDKKVALLNARGGYYSEGPAAQLEMSLNYMKTMVGFFGVQDPVTVVIEGHNAVPDQAEEIINKGLEEVKKVAQSF